MTRIHREFIGACYCAVEMAQDRDIPIVEQVKGFGKRPPWWKRFWEWTGWREKKLWDWQALLFVPVTIALIAALFTQCQHIRQLEIENQRSADAQQLETLRAERAMVQAYLEHMGMLLLEKNLREVKDEES